MNCERWRRWLALDAGGDLSVRRTRRLQVHLQRCPECRTLSRELRSARGRLQALAASAAPHEATMQTRPLQAFATTAARRQIPVALRWSAAATALLLVVVVGYRLAPRRPLSEEAAGPAAVSAAAPTPIATPPDEPGRSSPAAPAPPATAAKLPPQPGRPDLRTAATETLVLKIHTDDPEVVIYWLVETEERKSDA